MEEYFFYTVLQQVQDGLVERISDYPGYNCFHDAIWGVKREYKVVNWGKYNAARRFKTDTPIKDYITVVTLEYDRLPGYEHLSRREYAVLMQKKLEERRARIVEKRRSEGRGFAGRENLLRVARGARPENTKTSTRFSHRPRVLCVCPKRRREHLTRYFETYRAYKAASREYRSGNLNAVFPEGTYKPYCWNISLQPSPDTG